MFDSSKSSVTTRIVPFLPQEAVTIDHFMLHQKRTYLIRIYLLRIDTDTITYPTDTHQRQRSIPMLSHIPCRRTQAPRSHIHAYTQHRPQHIQNIKYFIYQIKYRNITIKDLDKREGWRRLGSISCIVGRHARSFVRLGRATK